MTRCPGCGRELAPDVAFCHGCGRPRGVDCERCGRTNPFDALFCGGCGAMLGSSGAPRAAPAADLPATLASGRYRIEELLGEGARKRVHRAFDTRLERDVAIALLKTAGFDETAAARLRRETAAMGRLGGHPNIVTVHDVAEDDGTSFIVTELLLGGDLEQRLRDHPDGLPLDEVVRIAEQVVLALEHAHAHGVVHRDVKPSNIWVADDGSVRLGDFGLAVALDRSRMTAEGMIVGTVAYLAPEQAIGRRPDTRSDLYSLGAVLYELATGRPPFVGDDAVAVISQHLHTAPVAPSWHNPAVSAALEELVLALLAKAPEDRPQTAAEVSQALTLVKTTAGHEATRGANPLDRLAGGVFVGRDDEVTALRAAFDDALAGRGKLALVGGEPGIGKTRTAEELATYARLRGAQVLWGRCYEGEGAPAYWPWIQVVRAHAHDREASDLRSELGAGGSVIAQVVPELREQIPDLGPAPALDAEAARFALFDSLATFLKNAAQRQPLVLVLDDLHWADEPSLLLLRHLAAEITVGRLLIVATYRDIELGRHHPLANALGELARHATTERVVLRGLSREDVSRYIEIAAARTPPPGLVDAVHRETEGNPFFVAEVVRLLASEGRIDSDAPAHWSVTIPQGVREVIGRRLQQLGERANEVLAVGAVIGREFWTETVVGVHGGDPEEIEAALDAADGARILDPLTSGRPGYRFAHALVRETLYDELASGRRIRLHRRIAEVIEQRDEHHDQAALAELAYHFSRGAPGGDLARAIDYARRAAKGADDALAYEEASRLYRLALDDLELALPVDQRLRYDLLVALGGACRRAARIDEARDAFREAVDIAEALGDVQAMGEAALGFARPGLVAGIGDLELIALIERTLALHRGGDTLLEARLLARLSMELSFVDTDRQRAVAAQALAAATTAGDPAGLAVAHYVSSHSLYDAPHHLDSMERSVALGSEAGDLELASLARLHLICGYWWFGRVDRAREEIEVFAEDAARLRQPFFEWHARWFRAAPLLDAGQFDEGLRVAAEAFAVGERVSHNDALQGHTYQRLVARRTRADVIELITPVSELVERVPSIRVWWALRALLAIEVDDRATAEAMIDALEVRGHLDVAVDAFRIPALAVAAEVCWHLGRTELSANLHALLAAEEGTNLVFGAFAALLGSRDRYVGIAAAGAGLHDQAVDRLRHALDEQAALGSLPWCARTHLDLARALAERGGDGDRDRALAHASEAIELGRELGMALFVDSAVAFKLATQGAGAGSASIHAVAAAAAADKPDLVSIVPAARAGGTVTILFTDIESSTALAERVGDSPWLTVLRAHNALIRRLVQAHGGSEVKARGDGFMLAFASARQAVRCAIAIQTALHDDPIPIDDGHIRVRIGLHTGEALRDERDLFGRHVNLAARVADAAAGGQILVSSLTRDLLVGEDFTFDEPRQLALKGVTGEQVVVPVRWSRAPSVAGDMEQAATEQEDAPHASG